MDFVGAIFLVLAVVLVVGIYISRPFFSQPAASTKKTHKHAISETETRRSALMAERDRVLTSLQDLEFDHALGKIPEEDYPYQRAAFLHEGAEILRQLDEVDPRPTAASLSAEDRLEAAVAARRADARIQTAAAVSGANGGSGKASPAAAVRRRPVSNGGDDIENLVNERRRARQEKAVGFCPRCGKPVQASDKFCSKCGAMI
jgi:hypothetical protein